MIALLLALQSASPEVAGALAGVDYDLRRAPVAGEIVVIGRRMPNQRLRDLPIVETPALPRAAIDIGGVRASIDVDQQRLGAGMASNRLMITLRLPF